MLSCGLIYTLNTPVLEMSISQKTGRNDPCPCGSGKKHKKCCLVQESAPVMDFEWRKIRRTEGEVIDQHLLPFASKTCPKEMFSEALQDFLIEEDLPDRMKEMFVQEIFIPWYLFSWVAEGESKPIAIHYLEQYGRKLSEYQKRFIENLCQTHYSFYVVLEVIPNLRLKLRDIFLQTEHEVKEKSGTAALKRGDIIYTRILTLDGQSICMGMGGYVVPSHYHTQLLDLRNELEAENEGPLNVEVLRTYYEEDLRSFFIDVVENQYNPRTPEIRNTDDEPLELCKVYCALNELTPEETLQRLMPLTLSSDPENFLRDAKRDKSGGVTRIEFPWLKPGNQVHKDWPNTGMGNIVIDGQKLTVEVNSENRAKNIQELLKQYLQEGITIQKTRIESLEQKLKSSPSRPAGADDINQRPEVRAMLDKMAKEHYEKWLDMDIPALGGITPRAASKTQEGRERLEALLLDFERKNQQPGFSGGPDVSHLRKQLGLE